MAGLSQAVVEYLNHAGSRGGLGEWLVAHPALHHFVTCPYISIRPTAMPEAQRITAFDGHCGRYIDIQYRDGGHRYLINIASWNLTVEEVETLIHEIEDIGGSCHVERTYLILATPPGYRVEISGELLQRQLHLRSPAMTDSGLIS